MTSLATRGALPSIEKARELLTHCRTLKECLHIKAIAQAVASVESSEAAREEAAAIVLLAKARVGELTAEMVKNKGGRRPTLTRSGREQVYKSKQLEAEGLTRKDAAECEKIRALQKSGDLDRMIKRGATTTAAALTIAKLAPSVRTEVFAKIGESVDFKKAIGEVKLDARRDLAAQIRKNPIVTPDGRYHVIAIDPPWSYDNRADDTTHRGKNLYPDMSTEQLCALPVAKLAQSDCVLWLWTTNAFMREAYACLDAWGFKDKTILTWDKVNIGLGDYLRNVTEHCILATRGRPVLALAQANPPTTLITEKRREHSRKPEAFYDLVGRLCPGSKLEMFARAERKGWTAWGAEKGKFT